jgi:hypothetical protein
LRYITLGGDLNGPSMRRVFADLVRKKMKRSVWEGPAYKKVLQCYRASLVAEWMLRLGVNKTAAVATIAERWGVSKETVWSDVRKWGLEFDHLAMDLSDDLPWIKIEECCRRTMLAKRGNAKQPDFLVGYPS